MSYDGHGFMDNIYLILLVPVNRAFDRNVRYTGWEHQLALGLQSSSGKEGLAQGKKVLGHTLNK
jgi:hypothetical protein